MAAKRRSNGSPNGWPSCSASSSRPSGPSATSRPISWPCRCSTARSASRPGHTPLIGRLGYGEMRIRHGKQTERFYVDGGFVQVVEQRRLGFDQSGRFPPTSLIRRQAGITVRDGPKAAGRFSRDAMAAREIRRSPGERCSCGLCKVRRDESSNRERIGRVVRIADVQPRLFHRHGACGATELVSHTLEPITESWPITVLPPRIVALA